jgi:alkanesulfonate monooxygenase SsuD/methylene tetrahydromethanopterin reductase-like flavin-dependent oxidoreductase (luciferase family)
VKFGIDYFPDAHPDRVSGQQYFADVLDLAEFADDLGYDSVKIVEHHVAPTRQAAREECRPYMEQYLRNFRASARAWTGRQSGQYKPYSALEQMLEEITFERVLAETRALIGDPDDVARQLEYIRHTFGEVYPTFQINFGMMEKARARRSLELFARHVMPHFR